MTLTSQGLSHVIFILTQDDLYTYSIMAASAIGYIISKRGGYTSGAFGAAFAAAPVVSLYQKRELDFYESSTNALYLFY